MDKNRGLCTRETFETLEELDIDLDEDQFESEIVDEEDYEVE